MLTRLVIGLKPHPPPLCSQKKWNASFLDYAQLLMIGRAEWWTQTPSTIPLQPKKWNAHFWITFNFWWLAGLVDGLKPHPPLLSSQKNLNAHFWIMFTSDDQPGWLMNLNPICHPSPTKKMKCSFLYYIQLLMIGWDCQWTWTPSTTCLHPIKWNAHILIMFNFWWLARLVNGLEPHPPPVSSQKKWNAHFWILFNFSWFARLVDGLKPHPPPSPAKRMKCSFLDYAQLLMISQAVRWNQTPSATPLQTIKWNAHFWITFNFWWSAGLVDGLEPHPPPVSSQKWNVHILIMFNFWWLAGLVNGLKPHPSPLSSQKNEMLIFVLRSTSDVGHPIHHPSPANKMKCFFLDNVHFWWSAILVDGLKPRLPPLSSQRDEILIFVLCLTSNDQLGWSMDSNPICHPFPAKTVKCSFLYYIQHLMLARLVNGLEPHPPPLSSQ